MYGASAKPDAASSRFACQLFIGEINNELTTNSKRTHNDGVRISSFQFVVFIILRLAYYDKWNKNGINLFVLHELFFITLV